MNCEMPQAYSMATPKARKQHKCCECGGVIAVGEKYNRHSGVWENTPASYKVCVDCDNLRADMNEGAEYDERTGFGCIRFEVGDFDEDTGFLARFLAIQGRRAAAKEKGE